MNPAPRLLYNRLRRLCVPICVHRSSSPSSLVFRRPPRSVTRCAALHRATAARALHPHPVVLAQVPVLRLQLARAEGRAAGAALRRRAADRSRVGAAVDLGPQVHVDLLRRRHAEPVLAVRDRRDPRRWPRPDAGAAHRGDHARSESGRHRRRFGRGVAGRWRQPHLARRSIVRRPIPRVDAPHARQPARAGRGGHASRGRPRELVARPHLRTPSFARARLVS